MTKIKILTVSVLEFMLRVTISPENFGLKKLKQNRETFNCTFILFFFLSAKVEFELEFMVGLDFGLVVE